MIDDAGVVRADLSHLPPFWRVMKTAVLLSFLSFASRQLNEGSWISDGVTILWPTNAFLLGVLLCNPRRHWAAYIGAGFCIDFTLNVSLHNPLHMCAYLSACNMIEATLAAVLLYPVIAPKPDLTERRQLIAFMAFGVVLAPAVASFLASFAQHGVFLIPTLHDFHRWFSGDALGMATVTPLYLAFNQRQRFDGRSWQEVVGLFLLLLGVATVVFWQTRYPLLFVVMAFLLLLGVRLGLAGSALGLLLVSILGGFLLTAGHGPAALMTSSTLAQRDLLFQIYIASSMLMLYIVEVLTAEGKRLQTGLQGSERRFRLLAEASSDIIVLTDLQGKRHYVSPAASEVLGWKNQQIIGGSYRDLVHPEDVENLERLFRDCLDGAPARSLEYRCRKADGGYIWLEVNPRLYHDADTGEPAGFVNVTRDISRRKLEEEDFQRVFETVEHEASSDALTGIANRRYFDLVLEKEWLRGIREQTTLSLLIFDVDRFKPYNDVYGHTTGDECLRQVVSAVKQVICRPADLLARYGGEEFVVVLPDTDVSGAYQIAEWVRQSVEQRRLPHPGNPPHNVITLSVGYAAMVPSTKNSAGELIEAADRALYQAKGQGRNRVQLAGPYPEAASPLLTG